MKLGVLQGRLTAPTRGHYQEFPKQWFSEFDTIQRIGLHGIEWLITKDYNFNNPIYTSFDLIQNLPVMSICVDTLVDERIINKDFLFHSLFSLCNTIKDSKMNVLTIPILDESDLNNDLARAMFCEAIQSIGQAFPRVKFAFESEMSPQKLN